VPTTAGSGGSCRHSGDESSGLRTPLPPRLSTCVYTIVVVTLRWPRSSCTVRMSYPLSRRWVAKLAKGVAARRATGRATEEPAERGWTRRHPLRRHPGQPRTRRASRTTDGVSSRATPDPLPRAPRRPNNIRTTHDTQTPIAPPRHPNEFRAACARRLSSRLLRYSDPTPHSISRKACRPAEEWHDGGDCQGYLPVRRTSQPRSRLIALTRCGDLAGLAFSWKALQRTC
jgi:hypothetical protein